MEKRNYRQNGFQIILNFHSLLAKEVFHKVTKFILDNENNNSFYQIPIFEASKNFVNLFFRSVSYKDINEMAGIIYQLFNVNVLDH